MGKKWYVIHTQTGFEERVKASLEKKLKQTPEAHDFVSRLRPDRTVEEIWAECLDRYPDEAPGQEDVIQLLTQLYFANLLYFETPADSEKLFERYKKRRQREIRSKLLSIMFVRMPLLDPENFLRRIMPTVKYLISSAFAVLWLVVVVAAAKVVLDRFDEVTDQMQGILAPDNLVLLYESINSLFLGIKLPLTMPDREFKGGNPPGKDTYGVLLYLEPDPGVHKIS